MHCAPVQGDQARDGEKILLSCGRLCLHQYSSDQQVYHMPQSQKWRFNKPFSDLSGTPSRSPVLQNWKTSSASTSELLEAGRMPFTVLFPMKTKNGGRYLRQLFTSRAKLRSVPNQPGAPQSVASRRPAPWWSTLTAPTARPPPLSSPRNTRSSWPQG